MSYLVEMMDGTIIDLDHVVGISDIDGLGTSYNGVLHEITHIMFYLLLSGPLVNASFSNERSNRIPICLEKVSYLVSNYGIYTITKERHMEIYKLTLQYQRYLDFIELFKKHKNCETIIKI